MDEANISRLRPDENFCIDLGSNVWLMDDHRWAFLVWTRFGFERGIAGFSLVHADYHWDGINDFHENGEARRRLLEAGLPELEAMVRNRDGIKYESFIAPAVIRRLVTDVHFFCKQDDGDLGLDEDLLAEAGARQTFYDDVARLAGVTFAAPVIFDLCLDLFNRSDMWDTGDLWSDDEIRGFLEQIRPVIERAALVTVSLSFHYSGTEADTRYLASLVLPLIEQWRAARPSPQS